jgi:hypothetical protein
MDLEAWRDLFGKSQDDPAVKEALAAAGTRKIPKLGANSTDVRFDLKGHGLWLIMTDEADLKELDDLDIGEGPLILSGATAYLDKSASSDLYNGKLPYKITGDMTRADLRKTLGRPTSSNDVTRFDVWLREGVEIVARYTKDWKLKTFGQMLPGAE